MASEIVLVNVSGQDAPGLMAMLTSTLAQFQVHVLDIGQAVIHDELSLGMLVQIAARSQRETVQAELKSRMREMGVSVRFTDVTHTQYEDWVNSQGKPRYIVTLLAGHVAASQLAAVTDIIRRHGLNIDTIRRLSGRLPLSSVTETTVRTSIEMSLRGNLTDGDALKEELMAAAAKLTFDFSVQRDTVYRRNRRLVVFDMDSTLINAEVIDEVAKRHGVGAEVTAITRRAMRGELDFSESFRLRARLLNGLSLRVLKEVANGVSLNDGAHRLIRTLKHFGYKTAIISGGFRYVGEQLRDELGIDYVYANDLETRDGVLTGEVHREIIDAPRKAELLEEIALREGISMQQTIAIGDGANDLPMLNAAGLGVAYHAKPLVKETARHAISNFGLDSVLYLMGFSDRDIEQALAGTQP
ncbi:MAG: phosphoserine phosphatase SerB [Gammaproteobacteria bacterium]|nr:phosphoserine phosphatase SerB [Gammaproteobacteria bacterium]